MKPTTKKSLEGLSKSAKNSDSRISKRLQSPKHFGNSNTEAQRRKNVVLLGFNDVNSDSEVANKTKILSEADVVELPAPPFAQVNSDECAGELHGSRTEARKVMQWLIAPHSVDTFVQKNWEKRPLIVRRQKPDYYKNLLCCTFIHRALAKYQVFFGKDIEIISSNTHAPIEQSAARAIPQTVWQFFERGDSVRILKPAKFFSNVWRLSSVLTEFFNCFVNTSANLMPKSSQSGDPHFNLYSSFILQLEGKKRWKIYRPQSNMQLPVSADEKHFSESELGASLLDSTLQPGDILYIPRGFIYKSETFEDTHSLDITLYPEEKLTYGDFFKKLIPKAIDKAMEEDVAFRTSLPLNYSEVLGLVNSERHKNHPSRVSVLNRIEELFHRLFSHAPVDNVADLQAKTLIQKSLPPFLSEGEKACSVIGVPGGPLKVGGRTTNQWLANVELEADTEVRLVRHGSIRLVDEGDSDDLVLYYTSDNSRDSVEIEAGSLYLDRSYAKGVAYLIHKYPEYVAIESLPLVENKRFELVTAMWEKGILLTKSPLEPIA